MQRKQLLDALRSEYQVVCERLKIGGLDLEIFRVADPDSLLDDDTLLHSHDQLPWQPYWAQVWDAAHGVAWELTGRDLAGRHVLDLGCGLGIAGTVAAACGATVVMADNAPPALKFAELNSWPWRERVHVRRVDWRSGRLDRTFDLILGADILYDRGDLPYLDVFWRRHLTRGGTVFLGDPNRAMAREMLDSLGKKSWAITQTVRQFPQCETAIRMVELRLPTQS